MSKFFMMIGVAGSGKSTVAAMIAKEYNALVVSSDAIRLELFGDENDQEHNAQVFDEVHRRILAAARNGQNVIYDAMNIKAKYRRGFLRQLPKDVEKIAVVVATDYDIILKQNAARERHVPIEVIERAYKNIQMPSRMEGFDSISYVAHPDNTFPPARELYKCQGFDQDNPHHTLTLYEHLCATRNYVWDHMPDAFTYKEKFALSAAALYHDIGKPECKTYQLWSGKIDDHAHYYNHNNVGAYKAACIFVDKIDYDIAEGVIQLIQHHMDHYGDEKCFDKIEKSYGVRFRAMLELLCEADKNAH